MAATSGISHNSKGYAVSGDGLPATTDELTEAAGAQAMAAGLTGNNPYPGASGYSIFKMDAGEFTLPDTHGY